MTDASPSRAAERPAATIARAGRARLAAPGRAVAAGALLLVLVATAGGAMAAPEPREIPLAQAAGETVTIDGRLARYGNEPHTFLAVLVDPATAPRVGHDAQTIVRLERETVFRLHTDADSALNAHQGREVRVTGVLERAADAPGLPAEIRVVSWELAPVDDR